MKYGLILCAIALTLTTSYARYHKTPHKPLPDKKVIIKGPLITPISKGDICLKYRLEGKKINDCQPIAAGHTYEFVIPHRIDRVKVTRSFDKSCAFNRKHHRYCKTLSGHFDTPEPENTLILEHKHNVIYRLSGRSITHGYEPTDTLGWPTWSMTQPSILFDRIYNGDVTLIY